MRVVEDLVLVIGINDGLTAFTKDFSHLLKDRLENISDTQMGSERA